MSATPDARTVEGAVRAYFAALRAGDRDAWLACFADDATLADPVNAPPASGRAGLEGFWDQMTTMFERVELTEGDIYVAGPQAAAAWTGRNTARNGKVATFAGINTFEIDGAGRIREVRGYWDARAMLRQVR